ncbi:uncharacterized protein FOMMEDRAFT_153443 [Fomitiporia mediterranea MF3/22]|uniref:uncharacterized protein n=1 Tax=Fomitiporia mediterranea (strain MF3/22) TaxID=694068 RepID=UPI000440927A|nr:uncharacterized protein FOMMEDRAFT_153443 [Fomitiporia mediterranea MF3/22]EJD06081.1 hypothetical protein FOMMEDRAFT_153443 [Fomitiporia mediterranea MF3/22]
MELLFVTSEYCGAKISGAHGSQSRHSERPKLIFNSGLQKTSYIASALLLFAPLRMEPLPASRCPFPIDDLVPIIIQQASLTYHPKDLAKLSLVSSVWLGATRRILYSSPHIRSYHSCHLLSRTLADKPYFGNRIRALRLHPVSRICPTGGKCPCREVNTIALSLTPLFRLENLSELSLGGDCAIHSEWYLRSFHYTEGITKVRVEGMQWYWSFEVNRPINASLRWNESLASRYQNLKYLELMNVDLRICELQVFKPHLPHLETLIMDRVRITHGNLSNIAFDAWQNLRELTVVVPEYSPNYDVKTILLQAAQNLQALKYCIKEESPRNDLHSVIGVDVLASCTSLRDLQLSVLFKTSALKALGQRLTQLELLKVFGNYEVDIEEWAVEIMNGIFPKLREISLPIGHELRRLADWQWSALRVGTIRRACESRGIALTYVYLPD